MAQRSHVPKFGNWDNDNVPYTACFENARRGKAGTTSLAMMNPNDPEQNPEAFNLFVGGEARGGGVGHNNNNDNNNTDLTDDAVNKGSSNRNSSLGRRSSHGRNVMWQRSRESSHGSFTPDSVSVSASEKSNYSDVSVWNRRDSNQKSVSSFSSSGHHRRRSGSNSSHDFSNQKTRTIPKFGEWDERDPKSGEGFTLIFRKVKEEKQTESPHFPNVPSQLENSSNMQNGLSKYCCCLFSSESK